MTRGQGRPRQCTNRLPPNDFLTARPFLPTNSPLHADRCHNSGVSADSPPARLWPPERDRLLERYPRERWPEHASLDAAFWLEMHRRFRHECAALESLAEDFRQRRIAVRDLAIVAAPRVAGLLGDLRGHHQIEDHHYFPVFRRLAPALGAGIDVLERDHAELDQAARALWNAERELRTVVAGGADDATAAVAGRQFAAAASWLCLHIVRHLADEEDLVVPLLLEQEAPAP
jgi:hypothetical protein